MTTILACDPGKEGAFASISPEGIVAFFGMPMAGATLDVTAVWEYFRQWRDCDVQFVMEQSNPRPNEGRSSGAKYAFNKGVIWGLAVAAGFSVRTVTPPVWKKAFGLIGTEKPASKAKACELFASERVFLAKARADFSEALLLAVWLQEKIR